MDGRHVGIEVIRVPGAIAQTVCLPDTTNAGRRLKVAGAAQIGPPFQGEVLSRTCSAPGGKHRSPRRQQCPSTGHFLDVQPGGTFFRYVEITYSNGVIAGYSDVTFRPNNNVTRARLRIKQAAQGKQEDVPFVHDGTSSCDLGLPKVCRGSGS